MPYENNTFMLAFSGYLLLANVAGLVMMVMDKKRAVQHRTNRIPEKVLFRTTAMGGGIGTIVAMRWFRHKTRQRNICCR